MIAEKLIIIEQQIIDLTVLRDDLSTWLSSCKTSMGDCPILQKLEEGDDLTK